MTADKKSERVPQRVYYTYAKACTIPVSVAYFLSTLSWQGLRVCTDFWLSDWTAYNGTTTDSNHDKQHFQMEVVKPTFLPPYIFIILRHFPLHTMNPKLTTCTLCRQMLRYLFIYSALSVGTMLLSLFSNLVGQLAGARARHWLHQNLLSNLLRSPVKFFDMTPIGRVIDRLSTDIAVIDKVRRRL